MNRSVIVEPSTLKSIIKSKERVDGTAGKDKAGNEAENKESLKEFENMKNELKTKDLLI